MAGVNIKSWKGLFILSMLVPVSLFAGFKLTGVISGPATVAEITRLQPTVWNRERPYVGSKIVGDYSLNTSYVGSDVALAVRFCPGQYDPFQDDEGHTLVTGIDAVNASVPNGFIVSVEVAYREAYPPSRTTFTSTGIAWFFGNLTLFSAADAYTNPQALGGNKAYVKALAVGQPSEVSIWKLWLIYNLHSPYNYTHDITIEATVTYFNGTVYKQLVQPIEFVFGPDHNNSFGEAEEIGFGTRQDYVDNDPNGDPVDYFKIWLHEGQKVRMSVVNAPYPGELWPDVLVYDPDRNLEAHLFAGLRGVPAEMTAQNATSQTVLSINQTGWWYIKVTSTLASYFLYALDVSLVSA